MLKKICISLLLGCMFLSACHHHHHHDHSMPTELTPITYTFWQDSIEVLVAFPPLVQGTAPTASVTLTDLTTMLPLAAHVQWRVQHHDSIAASATHLGQYEAILPLPDAPLAHWVLSIQTPSQQSTFVLDSLPIAIDLQEARQLAYPNSDPTGSIHFSKKQWWEGDFAIARVQQQLVGTTIPTSGMVEPANNNLLTIVARRDGVVSFRKKNLTAGQALQAGEVLFAVAGRGIVSDELEMNYLTARSNLQRQKSHLQRQQQLLDERIIGQKAYDEALNAFQVAEAAFNNVQQLFSKGSKRHLVTAPSNGYLARIAVRPGDFVKAGQPLATIVQTKRLQVRVDVSPRYGHLLPQIIDAHFINPYTNEAFDLAALEGTILSFGKMTSHEEGHYLPFYVEVNNHPALLPGTLVEVYLQTEAEKRALTIPTSAVFEEMGSYVVFVQRSGEHYDKQVVSLGPSDGKTVQILKGLSAGDRVVSKGALHIKLAAFATNSGGHDHHGHNH